MCGKCRYGVNDLTKREELSKIISRGMKYNVAVGTKTSIIVTVDFLKD